MLKLKKSFVAVDLEAADAETVIQGLADRLHAGGMVKKSYGTAAIEREINHATGLPTKPFPIAFPHADAEGVLQSALAVAILAEPVIFKNMADPEEDLAVELVIMMANNSPEEQIETLRNLAEIFGEPEALSALRNIKDSNGVVEWLANKLVLSDYS